MQYNDNQMPLGTTKYTATGMEIGRLAIKVTSPHWLSVNWFTKLVNNVIPDFIQ